MPATIFQMARLLSRPPEMKKFKGSINERLSVTRKRDIAAYGRDNSEFREVINTRQEPIYISRMTEEKLIFDMASILHQIARLRETESVKTSLDIIDYIYRQRPEKTVGPLPPTRRLSSPQSSMALSIFHQRFTVPHYKRTCILGTRSFLWWILHSRKTRSIKRDVAKGEWNIGQEWKRVA
ncbi:hypothetical protein IW262DRAFT_155153 [Armillaria fumosa]|nr:hypothetical protein IW262DRAFT_155153 [Armillaria fumosa]